MYMSVCFVHITGLYTLDNYVFCLVFKYFGTYVNP
jgi:hypothetical protein